MSKYHPIKFAIADSSTTPEVRLTIDATGRIFVGAHFMHASELQNDTKTESYQQRSISSLSLLRAFTCLNENSRCLSHVRLVDQTTALTTVPKMSKSGVAIFDMVQSRKGAKLRFLSRL